MPTALWTTQDIPSQTGRQVVITGATGGLGYETALALAGAGANVLLTGRNNAKGQTALVRIRKAYPNATIGYAHLDLGSLASVTDFAERYVREHDGLDLLVNNAGVMTPPTRFTTSDGFELQFGTNYLGHFALTAQLLPLLRNGRQPRVVNLSSSAHRLGAAIHFDDLQWQRSYSPWRAYAQSKLAMLMFAFELQRRSDIHGWGLMSNACHPGYAVTDLQTSGPRLGQSKPHPMEYLSRWMQPYMSQSAADGALPTLFAATSPNAEPAAYYGPHDCLELKGPVGKATIARRARDIAVAKRLWEVSEQLTGARWPQDRQEIAA